MTLPFPRRIFFTSLAAGVLGVSMIASAPAQDAASGGVKLQPMKWSRFKERLADKKVKFTLVDVWATTCGPCKENFPHLVEMHRKFADKGLGVISLTLDDPTDTKAVAAAEKFLQEKQAAFTNVLLDENYGDGYDRLNINTIPAVFLFGPDGRELKRFTMDDPDHQFTYEEVEKDVAARLAAAAPASK
ncbi:MAG: TlpA disulfide reductase family protein [Isosphaeraceae bacterium]